MDQEDVLDEVRRLRFDLDLLRVADLVTVLVEHPLVRDSDRDGDRACAFRPHADPHGDDLAYADLRDRGDALRLAGPGDPIPAVRAGGIPRVCAPSPDW